MEIFRKSRKVTTTEQDETTEPKASLDGLVKDFSSYTTIHGFHFMVRAQSRIRWLIWVFLFITCFSVMIYQFAYGMQKYMSHPSVISKEVEALPSITFPAVSICNQNMMKKSKIKGTEAQTYLDHLTWFKNLTANMSAEFNIEKAVLDNGHNISDMLLFCKWGSQKCGPKNFRVFYSFWVSTVSPPVRSAPQNSEILIPPNEKLCE